MKLLSKKKIVLLGMMSRMPVGGNIWLVLHYLIGLERLGYEPYYVEAHGWCPKMLMRSRHDDAWQRAAKFIEGVMDRFDLGDRWAYHAIDNGNRYYGMTKTQLNEIYRTAEAIINLHGGTELLPEHLACPVRIYLGTDPVDVEVHVHNKVQKYIDLLSAHTTFFTWGTNYGNPDCRVPIPAGFDFVPTLPPVILDFWETDDQPTDGCFTTIGNWRESARKKLQFNGEVYHWSKHHEFLKFIDLPQRTSQSFELALSSSSYNHDDQLKLEQNGWRICDALAFSRDVDAYRAYIQDSRGEFTVAKDQNVRLRSGWFGDRSAQYLAAGRPVVTQETGFSNSLPTGGGLFAFSNADEIVAAVDKINSNYERSSRAARDLACDRFSFDIVLPRLLAGSEAGRRNTLADS